jgi:hypothetical protein
MATFRFPQTHRFRQTAIAVADSRAVLRRSNVKIKASEQALRSMHVGIEKSSDAIATSRDALAKQTRRNAAWKRLGF